MIWISIALVGVALACVQGLRFIGLANKIHDGDL